MKHTNIFMHGVPISISLNPTLEKEHIQPIITKNKKKNIYYFFASIYYRSDCEFNSQIVYISNQSYHKYIFHDEFSIAFLSPAHHSLGWIVIFIPIIGGLMK